MSVKEDIAPVSASQTAAPPSLLDEIMAQTRVQPKSESYDITRQGVSAFIAACYRATVALNLSISWPLTP